MSLISYSGRDVCQQSVRPGHTIIPPPCTRGNFQGKTATGRRSGRSSHMATPFPWQTLQLNVSQCSLYTFYSNPAPVIRSMQFHYCTVSNPGTGADDAFVLKRCVLRNTIWPSHSRPAIAAGARQFQICFLP